MGALYFVFIILTADGTGKILIKVSHWEKPIRNFITSALYQLMKNFSFCTPCWDASIKYGRKYFCGLQLFVFLSFLFLISIRHNVFSIKSKIALLLNTGRKSVIHFVSINLLGGFSWLFLGIKVKVFTRANMKYAN